MVLSAKWPSLHRSMVTSAGQLFVMSQNHDGFTMGRADVVLCKELIKNSRTSYQELAKVLGISVPAVHKRVQELMGQGVIRAFVAEIDITVVNGLSVMTFRRTEAPLATKVMDRLGKDGSTRAVLPGGRNHVFINAFLGNASEIEPNLLIVKEAGLIPRPTLGIHSLARNAQSWSNYGHYHPTGFSMPVSLLCGTIVVHGRSRK